jgi:KDO2-lipid IV(A) lauroyltransferase
MPFIRLLSRIPLPILYIFSDLLFFLSYHVIRYRRKLVQKQLKNSFPEKTENELKKIEKEFYRNLCDYGVEMLKLLTISKDELITRMRFKNADLINQFTEQNQSVIVLASHHFNWEWLLVAASVILPAQVDFVYQPVNSPFFEKLSLLSRSRFGAHPIRRDEVAREFTKRKNIVRVIATVADQYPGYKRDKKYLTDFLHQETAFFLGTNQLVNMTQFPCLYFSTKKLKRGYYDTTAVIVAVPPYAKDDLTVIENYVKVVEHVTNDYPAGWLWSHNRWKKRHLANPDQNVKAK